MKRSVIPVLGLAAFGVFAGAGLRLFQLTRCMNEAGLVRPGSRILYVMLAFVAVGLILTAVFCSRLNKTLGTERSFAASPVFLFLDLAAAIAIFFGSLLRLLDGGSTLLFAGGMAAACALAAAALLYGKKSPVTFWLLLLPCGFFAAQLIIDFKGWSTDPLVIDFCFRLLAQACGLLALFHISGFPLNVGRKRLTIYWSVGAAVFTAMTVPDFFLHRGLTLGQLFLLAGTALWCASHAVRLLLPACQEEQPAPEEPA